MKKPMPPKAGLLALLHLVERPVALSEEEAHLLPGAVAGDEFFVLGAAVHHHDARGKAHYASGGVLRPVSAVTSGLNMSGVMRNLRATPTQRVPSGVTNTPSPQAASLRASTTTPTASASTGQRMRTQPAAMR